MEQNFYINIITPIVYNITIISRSIPTHETHSTEASELTECTQDVDTICVESTGYKNY